MIAYLISNEGEVLDAYKAETLNQGDLAKSGDSLD